MPNAADAPVQQKGGGETQDELADDGGTDDENCGDEQGVPEPAIAEQAEIGVQAHESGVQSGSPGQRLVGHRKVNGIQRRIDHQQQQRQNRGQKQQQKLAFAAFLEGVLGHGLAWVQGCEKDAAGSAPRPSRCALTLT